MNVRNTTKFEFSDNEKEFLAEFIIELEHICENNVCDDCGLFEFCNRKLADNKPLFEQAIHIRLDNLIEALERGI